ncbi:MAG: hypothetical protein V4577_07505 [Bacteroidota bacterium]
MKNNKSKKLTKVINTICDFKSPAERNGFGETETGTDPTNVTVTTITTINTHLTAQRLTA